MPGEYDNNLLREGILHYRTKEFDLARFYLERALENADDYDTRIEANFLLSKLAADPVKKRKYLEEVLAIDLSHAGARRDLAVLDGKLKPDEIVDPEKLPGPFVGTESVAADRFTCPKCGGRMVFAPDGVSLFCESCQRQEKLASLKTGQEQDFFIAMANGSAFRKTVSTKTFKCGGCGAAFLLPPGQASAACAYCGSVHVIAMDQLLDLLEPDAVIPMALDQKHANRCLLEWIEKNRLELQEPAQPPRGLYLPVWTFDITGAVPWNGRIIRNRVEVPISGEEMIDFNNLVVPASQNLAGLLKDGLAGFNFSSAPAYDPRYMAGWPAGIYERPMADASLDARQEAVFKVKTLVKQGHGYVIDLSYTTSNISVTSFKLVLVPVWVAQVLVSSRRAHVLINGVSGSVCSELPVRPFTTWIDSVLGK
jgi:DNA-directed RNA polymerase subunit RPC12/RpoP